MQTLQWLFQISRPRFWLYLLGPFLLGIAAYEFFKIDPTGGNYQISLVLGLLFFSLPANLLIYGINDLFDYDTDQHNPKKKTYEQLLTPDQRRRFTSLLLSVVMPLLVLLVATTMFSVSLPDGISLVAQPNYVALWSIAGFLFFGIGYSTPPLRAKVRPSLDSFFNVLYVFPGLVSYGILTNSFPPMQIIIAATLWCMAMHAFSAVPDITSDKKAGLQTIATKIGRNGTILFCATCYLLSASFAYDKLGWFSIAGSTLYVAMMWLAYRSDDKELFKLYKAFSYVNAIFGFMLFWYIIIAI